MSPAPRPTPTQLARLGDALGGEVAWLHRFDGGIGCTMDLLAVDGERVVLRRYGPWYDDDDDPAGAEWSHLGRLLDAGVAVPTPRWIDREGVFDEHALVLTYLDGAPLFDPADPDDWADQLALALVAIHGVDPAGLPAPEEALDLDGSRPGRFDAFPLGGELWDACVATRPAAPTEQVFLHADFWPGNTLWQGQRLVATIDWEHPAVGDPMLDLAYTELDLRYLGSDDVADRFVSTYLAASGRRPETLRHWRLQALGRPLPDIAPWVRAWTGLGLDIPLGHARARHLELARRFLA